MAQKDLVWEARKQVLFSYGHKAVLLLVACAGFATLQWLGDQKDAHDDKKWIVDDGVKTIFNNAIYRVSDAGTEAIPETTCREPDNSKRYETREELIAAIQGRAEACVWAKFRGTVNQVREKTDILNDYTRYTNFINQEQAFAAAKANAVRQYVGTMLMSRELPPKRQGQESSTPGPKPNPIPAKKDGLIQRGLEKIRGEIGALKSELKDKIQPTLDDRSSTHVIYQILWYASLLLGVGASSMLFIVILTAIPITNGEGYWAERIGKILDRVPSVAGRSIAVPLLAAAIGGGTLAGAAAQTQSGGQARIPDGGNKTNIEPAALINSWSLVEVDTYNDLRKFRQLNPPPSNPPLDLTEVTSQLKDLNQRTQALSKEAETAKREVEAAVNRASSKISDVMLAAQGVEERVDHMQRTIVTARAAAEDLLACANDLRALEVQAQAALGKHMQDTELAANGVEGREELQKKTFGQTLAQSTEYDMRPFLKRTFGRTLYHVGPAVQTMMAARFDNEEPSSKVEKKALLKALEGMRDKEQPLNRRDFEQRLLERLENPPKDLNPPEDLTLTSEQIKALKDKHLPALLRICALPR